MKKICLSLLIILSAHLFVQAQDSTMKQYAGKYKVPNAEMLVAIEVNQGDLVATIPEGTFPLKSVGVDTYDLVGMRKGGLVVFLRDDKKRVTAISLSFNNIVLEGIKED